MRRLSVIVLLLLCMLPVQTARAQDDPFSLDDTSETAAAKDQRAERSLAGQFFISHRVLPGGERKVEWIGTLIIWFLLILSFGSIGLIGYMAMTNRRTGILPSGVVEQVRKHLTKGQYRAAIDLTSQEQSFFSEIMHASLKEAGHGYASMIRTLELTADELATNRVRQLEYLHALGNVSPMIGLFGTVYGMILAFQAIVVASGNADPVLLAGGIGTALITTFWGLIVAIPALAGYAVVRNRIDSLTAEAMLVAGELLGQFRPKPRSAPDATKEAMEKPGD